MREAPRPCGGVTRGEARRVAAALPGAEPFIERLDDEEIEVGAQVFELPPVPSPIVTQRPRLKIDIENKVAILDDAGYPVTTEQAAILEMLLMAKGGRVTGGDLKAKFGSRVDQIIKRIPEEIRRFIDGKRGNHGGYCLRLE